MQISKMSGSVSSEEGELNAIVKEFLEYSKLNKTVACFEEECQKIGKPIQDWAGKSRKDERISKIKNELLQHFDNGRRTEFFSEWETHINPEMRENNSFCQKLEFNLQIHFAVLPMRKVDHWCKEEIEEAMLHFHYYLESRGSILSDCSEFLPYYALPYVPRPNTHPSFSELFQESWVSKLRSKLEMFAFEGLKGKEDEIQEPRLIELYHNRDLDLQDARKELQYLERHIEESEKRSVLNAKKCEKLQEECRQLMAVASLLVTALENAVKGNLVDMDGVIAACTTHLPDLERLRSESPNFIGSLKDSNISSEHFIGKKLKSAREKLDFDKLRQDLRVSDDKKKSLLFQALRWRLTKVGSWHKREGTILEFVNNDLIDLHASSDESVKVLLFVKSNEPLLQESFARFLNAFSCFVLGRQYLTPNSKLLELLVEYLISNTPKKNIVLDMVLGTLKKLSIRKTAQTYLVEGGVIEWIINAIHSKAVISDYAMHSAIALLFNLSLCPMGKKRCEPLKVELISGFGRLLQLQDSKISPYVNGILYRILSIPSVKEYAKEQALPTALRKVMVKTEGEPKKQLETILELFVTDVQIEDGSSDEEDDDQENDSLEPEIDANDKLKPEVSETDGENLLKFYYDKNEVPEKDASLMENSDTLSNLNEPSEVKSMVIELSANQSSQLGTSNNSELPVTPKLDVEATQLVRKIVGMPSTTLVEAAVIPDPASVTIKGLNANEYTVAFSSRPKIPRTPEPSEIMSPKIGSSSPLRTALHKEYSSTASTQGIYCNN